ncbi:hypothetical protein Sru01_56050 [Sphaerisporangium rufum]|uniref:Uncharacterized protein n=1 Tax=Sphaerisporangium rufum TaxID=1381558 RepID=A0A919V3Z1_9ACTN|nr:hypothetical protein [Sphaerisporangium rufum]GII80623.1 hypothetical protein Sru01_56050 [Sphaerisporangium rufum]
MTRRPLKCLLVALLIAAGPLSPGIPAATAAVRAQPYPPVPPAVQAILDDIADIADDLYYLQGHLRKLRRDIRRLYGPSWPYARDAGAVAGDAAGLLSRTAHADQAMTGDDTHALAARIMRLAELAGRLAFGVARATNDRPLQAGALGVAEGARRLAGSTLRMDSRVAALRTADSARNGLPVSTVPTGDIPMSGVASSDERLSGVAGSEVQAGGATAGGIPVRLPLVRPVAAVDDLCSARAGDACAARTAPIARGELMPGRDLAAAAGGLLAVAIGGMLVLAWRSRSHPLR